MDENMWERWGAAAGVVFVVLLMIAFVYVWRRGALEWK